MCHRPWVESRMTLLSLWQKQTASKCPLFPKSILNCQRVIILQMIFYLLQKKPLQSACCLVHADLIDVALLSVSQSVSCFVHKSLTPLENVMFSRGLFIPT